MHLACSKATVMLLQQCGDQDGINIQLIGGFFEATDLPEIGVCVRGGDEQGIQEGQRHRGAVVLCKVDQPRGLIPFRERPGRLGPESGRERPHHLAKPRSELRKETLNEQLLGVVRRPTELTNDGPSRTVRSSSPGVTSPSVRTTKRVKSATRRTSSSIPCSRDCRGKRVGGLRSRREPTCRSPP